MEAREKFLRAYADVPDSLRKEIIVVINDKTYTWDSAFFEINNNTELADKLLNTLVKIGIIEIEGDKN